MFMLKVGIVSLLALALVACAGPTEDAPTLAQFETLDRASAQTAYQALAPAEQASLWRQKLTRELPRATSHEVAALVRDVRDHVDEILGDPAVSARYRTRAVEVVGEDGIDVLFGSFDNAALDDESIPPEGGVPCNDRWNCGGGCTCGEMPNQSWACHYSTCDRTCSATSSGCGWFWSQSCTGIDSTTLVRSC